MKALFTLAVFETLLPERKLVLTSVQRGITSKSFSGKAKKYLELVEIA